MPQAHAPRQSSVVVSRLVALVFFLQLLDSTVIATSLPHMARDFGVDAVAMSIGLTSYLLAMVVVIPASGWIAERFGTKRVLIASITFFTLASLACGLAWRLEVFVAARIAQGAAAALMAPVGRLLVLRHSPKSELMKAIATITWPALFAPVVGPVLGGWITGHFGWAWNFYINIPLGVLSLTLFWVMVPTDAPGARRPFDLAGFGLFASALILFLGGMEAIVAEQTSAIVILMPLVGLVLATLAIRHLGRTAAPLFDLAVCRVTSFRMATLTAGTLGRITINATPFLLPLLFQVGFGLSALEAGQLLLIYFLGNLLMKAITTPVMRQFGFRRVLAVNGIAAAACVGSFAALDPGVPTVGLWIILFVAGATRSLQFTALNTLAFADIGPEARASSTTLSAMTQQVTMLLGVAIPVLLIRISEIWNGAEPGQIADFRSAFVGMALIGIGSAVSFLALDPDTGSEVTGHKAAASG